MGGRRLSLAILALALGLPGVARAQATPCAAPPPTTSPATPPSALEPGMGRLTLAATLRPDSQPVRAGVTWRVFSERAENDGSHALVAQSDEARPTLILPNGDYIVHAASGLAGVTKRIVVNDNVASERVALNAGALKVVGVLADQPIAPAKLSIAIYVPERGNSEAKLVLQNAKANDPVLLPEGTYHIVSTFLDTVGIGSLEPENNVTNSVVSADIRVPAGRLVETTVRHRAAVLTLKLVNAPGGEALANTNFTILTPGGDVIRELIGAFPSLVLAEGEYDVIARHDGKTYQSDFKVQSALDRDIEVIVK